MNDADPSGLTSAEETHRVDVHQTQFLQVQNNPWSAGANLGLQFFHINLQDAGDIIEDLVGGKPSTKLDV